MVNVFNETRMHSSIMCTVRSSGRISGGCTWSRGYLVPGGCTWSRVVYLVWGVYLVQGGGVSAPPGVCTSSRGGGCTWSQGVYLVPGGTWSGGASALGGVPGPRAGCTWSWGVYPVRGVSAPGGVPSPGGGICSSGRGCTWSGTPTPPPVDRQTPVKT